MKPAVRSHWARAVLVCRKCQKRAGGKRLAGQLRKIAGGKGRKARFGVIETGCLGVCPKGAIVMIDGAAPGEWLLAKARTPVADVVERLGLTPFRARAEPVEASPSNCTDPSTSSG